MPNHPVVTNEQWFAARKELLQREKEFTRLRDELTQQRRDLPWRKVEKQYTFKTSDGSQTLAELFGECSQLLIYHFMFDPDWTEGCKSCSLIADHYDPLLVHLKHRDVAFVTVSRAPLETLQQFQQRMGWTFPWVSSLESDFNWDFHVSFTQEDLDEGRAEYNYEQGAKFPVTECPGISSFCRDAAGSVFHAYSSFGRGLEDFLGIYRFLDIVPKGRDEEDLRYGMAWVRHRDRYDDATFVDPYL